MKKLNLYKMIKSDMMYIHSTTQSLLGKAIEMQDAKVYQKAERVKRYDYEVGLIARAKQ
jgi:hypothetical protein